MSEGDTIGDTAPDILTERIGIYGVLALVVGNAIGIPIFVLPGSQTAAAGPSVLLATVLAAVPAGFVVLYNAQLGSAMPVAGGLYVYISRLTAPFWGFLVPWTLPVVTWAALLFTAIGFADYVRYFVDVPRLALLYLLIVGVLVVNLVGIRLVAQIQIALVGLLAAAIVAFVVPGVVHVDPGHLAPAFPEGYGPFAFAIVALYYPYLGFGLLTELGEEIDEPSRTIPVALLSGVAVVAVTYFAMIAVLVGVVPRSQLVSMTEGEQNAAIANAAATFLPDWAAAFVAFGAFFAVATSVNTSFLVSSRTIMRAGRDGILPEALSRIHPRFGTPYVSILLLGVPPLLVVPVVPEVGVLAIFVSLAVLTATFFSAIGLWNLPAEFPDHYDNAVLRLERGRGLLLAVLGGASTSALLWMVILTTRPAAGVLLVGWFLLGYGYFRYRVRTSDGARTLYLRMQSLADHEDAFAEQRTYEGAAAEADGRPTVDGPEGDGGPNPGDEGT